MCVCVCVPVCVTSERCGGKKDEGDERWGWCLPCVRHGEQGSAKSMI